MTKTHYFTRRLLITGLVVILFLAGKTTGFAQDLNQTRINEYYWGTPLNKVLGDLKNKYKIPINYDSVMVADYKLDYLFSNTVAKMALDIIFREIKHLFYIIDSDNVVQVMPRELSAGNM